METRLAARAGTRFQLFPPSTERRITPSEPAAKTRSRPPPQIETRLEVLPVDVTDQVRSAKAGEVTPTRSSAAMGVRFIRASASGGRTDQSFVGRRPAM